jgi:hypothetical protein
LNRRGRLEFHSSGLSHLTGWWNALAAGDVDLDGDIDYVVTNCGLNTRYHASPDQPAVLLLGDFDNSNRKHLIEGTFDGPRLVPVRSRNALAAAMPSLAARFPSAQEFAEATLEEVLTSARMNAATRFAANTLESGVLFNNGRGDLTFHPLPRLAQIAPSFGAVLVDADADGALDLVLAQNSYSPQPETGRMDGGLSLFLRGDGQGSFTPVWPDASGLALRNDAKSLATTDLNDDGWPDLVFGLNNAPPQAFALQPQPGRRRLLVRLRGRAGNPTAVGARVELTWDNSQQVAEVYAGGGYLSQSSPVLNFGYPVTAELRSIRVRWPNGITSLTELEPHQTEVEIKE